MLFRRLILRALAAEPLRTALTVFAVALGVGVVVAIELAGQAAAGSFRASLEALTGDADLEITTAGGVDERILGQLASLPYPLTWSPRVEGFAAIDGRGAGIPLVGLDLIQHDLANAGGRPEDSLRALRDRSSVWASRALGFQPGERVRLTINDHSAEYVVRGIVEASGGSGDRWLVMDIGAAQHALAKAGRLDRIDVRLPAGAAPEQWLDLVARELPAGLEVRPQGAQTEANRKMLAAFRWNLRVLSYISLIVGAFLIYNTIAISVVRRRVEIGVLRALGASRVQMLLAFLAEAVFLGAAGAVAGLFLGRMLAEGAVELIAATVDSLYISSAPAAIEVTVLTAVTGFGLGVVIALVSALAPALEAARVAPVEAMARGRRDYVSQVRAGRNLAFGATLALAAAIASGFPPAGGKPVAGYVAALLLIGAAALAIPAVVSFLSRMWPAALARVLGVEAQLASRSLGAALNRTSVLVAALATAVAMMASVGIMVGSFRQTVSLWLDDQLRADFYLRPAGGGGTNRLSTLSADLADRIEALPGVAAVDRFRTYDVAYNGLPAILGAGDTAIVRRYGRTSFLPGQDREGILTRLPAGDFVIASEPFANKHGVTVGSRVRLALGGVPAEFEVLGIYRDFSNERGYLIMDRGTLLRYLPDPSPSSLAVYLDAAEDIESARRRLEEACAGHEVVLFTNRSLREEAMRIFDRTFAITYALEAVAVVVAVMGIAGALLALVIDRRREMSVLRFLGATAGQIRRLVLFEAGLLGLLANFVGLALGFALSLILIFVINRQSFGWTIEFHLPVALLTAGLTVVYASTVVAGLYPARVAARLNPIEVVHEE